MVPYGLAWAAGAVVEGVWAATSRRDLPPLTRFTAEQVATAHWFDQRRTERRSAGARTSRSTTGSPGSRGRTPQAESPNARLSADPCVYLGYWKWLEGEAVQHYRQSGSYSGFDEGVKHGVSHELVDALHTLAEDADEATITIDFEPGQRNLRQGSPDYSFEFTGADAAPLAVASQRLAVVEAPKPGALVRGRVHLLTKKQGAGPGVVGLESTSPDGPRTVRVRLSPEAYHRAVAAHYMERIVSFKGRLEREGNLHWLYDAEMLGPDPATAGELQGELNFGDGN